MIDFQFMESNELILAQEYLMARSDLSNVSSDLSSTENLLDSTDDASFPDTDEVSYCVIILYNLIYYITLYYIILHYI